MLTACGDDDQPTDAACAALAADAAAAARAAPAAPADAPHVLFVQPGAHLRTGGQRNMALLALGLRVMGFPVSTLAPPGPARALLARHGVAIAGEQPAAPASDADPLRGGPSALRLDPRKGAAGKAFLPQTDLAGERGRPPGTPGASDARISRAAVAGDARTHPARRSVHLQGALALFARADASYRACSDAPHAAAVAAAVDGLAAAVSASRGRRAPLGDLVPLELAARATAVLDIHWAMQEGGATVCVADLADHAVAAALAVAGRQGRRAVWYAQNSVVTPHDAWLQHVLRPVAVDASVIAARFAGCAHCRVARNGVNTERFAPGVSAADGERPLRIGQVGYLHADKNQATLVRACAAAAPALGDFELWLIGGGRSRGRDLAVAAAAASGIGARVHFLGHRDDVPELLRQLDIFAFPSRHEGFGLAVAEAMASGVATVASDLPPIRAFAGDAATLLPPDDVAAWAEALTALATDPSARAARGRAARQRILDMRLTQGAMLEDFAAALGDGP